MRKNKNSLACWLMSIAQGVLLVAIGVTLVFFGNK